MCNSVKDALYYVAIFSGILSLLYFIACKISGITFSAFFLALGLFLITFGAIHFSGLSKALYSRFSFQIGIVRVLLFMFVLSFFIVQAFIIYSSNENISGKVDYIIVLGASVKGTVPSKALAKRLDSAILYVKRHNVKKIVLSGGKGPGEDITEAEAMKEYMIKRRINEDIIVMEDKSKNTEQNIKNSLDVLKKYGYSNKSNLCIVTNDFHVFRAKLIAKKFGVNAQGISAGIDVWTIPVSYSREYFAVIKFIIWGKILNK